MDPEQSLGDSFVKRRFQKFSEKFAHAVQY
jgi:hypothetical protein